MQLATLLDDAGFMNYDGKQQDPSHKYVRRLDPKVLLNELNSKPFSKSKRFVEIPEHFNRNNDDDLILSTVIAWSFYPKLLKRDGKGWRNVANNQVVSLHPASVNKGVERPPDWLSFYHIMQSSNKWVQYHLLCKFLNPLIDSTTLTKPLLSKLLP